ncbi:DUF7289 family protein [Methanocorpusculum parvum]|uniref:Flagellin n=1 Tax=Methanocorpusculum parvum TaxID=2193 RepID=A0AAX0Q6S7_9EURY|nr:hypothetical protein [Methanocorpusculum parvum]PAV08664.1 hypothetical protein ASJ83_03605 [Methanocorpusculum parvum]
MMEKRDSGLSIAVGFVMILLVIAMIIGMWAVVGVPEQIRDAEEYHAVKVTNAFLDYKIAVDSQRTRGLPGSEVSMLIPAASAYADGALFMEEGVGNLSITGVTPLPSPIEISRLYATFGTTNTRIGYEAGGVYRNDYGRAAWVTPPSLSLEKIGNDVYVNMVVPKMLGSFAVGSSEGIPVDTLLVNISSSPSGPEYQMITITYEADHDDPWDALLWSAFFYETKITYRNIVEDITVELTDNIISMKITPLSGESIHLAMTEPEYRVDVRGS